MLPGLNPTLETALADRYRFERELGRGGWGVVYLAHDLRHDRPVAIKVLHGDRAVPHGERRFSREIAIAGRLNHPHIVPLLDSGEMPGSLYYVMPFIEGETLGQRLRRERQLPVDEALRLAHQVATALAHAHDAGIVHRDIKPSNILLSGGQAVVLDFGIARAIGRPAEQEWTSSTGVQIGTPAYMSPEQATGESEIDGRSDIYSLGCVLYEMLAGVPPFTGATAVAVLSRHSLDTVPPIRTVRSAVPMSVERVIARALAKVPADRYADATDFARDLEAARLGYDVAAPGGRLSLAGRRTVIGPAIALASLLIIAVAAVLQFRSREVAPAARSWILLADFEAPEAEPSLGVAVRELVAAGLNQASNLSVVPREQVAQARSDAGIPDSVALRAPLARELAVRTSVRVIVHGSVQRIGQDGYSLVLNATDAETGEPRFSESAFTTDRGDALVEAVAGLVRDLRQRLGEAPRDIAATRPLMRVRTNSFDAFRRYADAMTEMRAGAYDRSNWLLHDAVARDSAFASAWHVMAMNYVTARRADSAAFAFARAAAYPGRLSSADLHRLQGDIAFNVDHNLEAAVQWYRRYLAEDPNSPGGHNNLGLYLSALGRHDEALREFEAAAAIDPLRQGPRQVQLMNIAGELIIIGRTDSAQRVAARLRGAPAQYLRLMLLNARDHWDSLAVAATAVRDSLGVERFVRLPAQTHAAASLAARGSLTAATEELLRLSSASSGAEGRWFLHTLLLLDLAAGRSPSWPLPAAIAADTSAGAAQIRGLHAALRGDTVSARRESRSLARRPGTALRRLGHGPALLDALLDARRRDWGAVRSRLAPLAAAGEHDPFSLDRVSIFPIRWLAAQASAQVGHLDSAAAELQVVVRPTGIPPGHYPLRGVIVPFAHRQLSFWYTALGDRASAERHWRAFDRAWSSPDASTLPLRQPPSSAPRASDTGASRPRADVTLPP